jgi:hypothetical protein
MMATKAKRSDFAGIGSEHECCARGCLARGRPSHQAMQEAPEPDEVVKLAKQYVIVAVLCLL